MTSLIIYTYCVSQSNDYNLDFFVKKELSYKNNIDYIIVINGYVYNENINFPILDNLTILKRENIGYDFGGHNYALEYIKKKQKIYDYYFFMNSDVIGPILPNFFNEYHWTTIFIKKIKDNVKLVGTTIVCLPNTDDDGYGPKVEGFFFMVDNFGLELLIKQQTIFCNHIDKYNAIVNGEYGLSNCILKNGYSLDCMLTKYKNIDWTDNINYTLNDNLHPSRKNSYYGNSIDPYDVIFHKWHWHNDETVEFDIIKKYVNDFNSLQNITILNATYGTPTHYVNVTLSITKLFLNNNQLVIKKNINLNEIFTDPCVNVQKSLQISAIINNHYIINQYENENGNTLLNDMIINNLKQDKMVFFLDHSLGCGSTNAMLQLYSCYTNNNIKTELLSLDKFVSVDIVNYIKTNAAKNNCIPILFCNTLLCYNIIKQLIHTTILTYWYIHEWYDSFYAQFFKHIIDDINTFNLMNSNINVLFACNSSMINYEKYVTTIKNYHILYNTYSEKTLFNLVNKQQSIITKNKNDIFISIIGVIELRKNQQNFIDNVFYQCILKYPNIKLLLVGKEYINLNIKDEYKQSIIIINNVNNALPFIHLSDIIISYSVNEVLPMNIIESFYCKKPVIASNVGGINEMITDGVNGFLIEVNDHLNCFTKICTLLDDPILMTTIGTNAQKVFYEKFCSDDKEHLMLSLLKNTKNNMNIDFNVNDIKQKLIHRNVCFIHSTNISNNDVYYKNILLDQLCYIKTSGLYNKLDFIFITVLGDILPEYIDLLKDSKIKFIYYSPDIYEWEFPTLIKLKNLCDYVPFNINVLYIHTKGVLKKPYSYEYRKYLEYFLIEKHDLCLTALINYKAVGVNQHFYFTPANKYKNLFDGNFWWTQSTYVKTLPNVMIDKNDRYTSEHWIIGNLERNDYRHFLSLHHTQHNLYKTAIMPSEYRLDIIKPTIINNVNKSIYLNKKVYGVYFICCIGDYLNIVTQTLKKLIESELYNNTEKLICFVCKQTPECIRLLSNYNKIQIIATDENLYEKFAINNYKKYIFSDNYDLFYLHTKSVSYNSNQYCINLKDMHEYFTINKWRLNIELLKYYDCVGIHLKNYPKKHYSGNFWWTTSEHLNRLPNSINDGYLSPEMYILDYVKTNYVSLYQQIDNDEYKKITNEELINNINIIPIYNSGDNHNWHIDRILPLDLSREPPIIEINS